MPTSKDILNDAKKAPSDAKAYEAMVKEFNAQMKMQRGYQNKLEAAVKMAEKVM